MKKFNLITLALASLASTSFTSQAVELHSQIGIEARYFTQDPAQSEQTDTQGAIRGEFEFYWDLGGNGNNFIFKPYFRADSEDSERHLIDIREAMYLHVGDDWEVRAGVGKVFWGVTETLHLVDIINQTDQLAAFDGEEKLGQPMVQLSLIRDWGVLEAFVLPYFREADFAGAEGRLRAPLPILDEAKYEDDDEENHIDFALRWSHTLGDWDVGLSLFDGTSRQAEFLPTVTKDGLALQAFYPQIQQAGLDAQMVSGDWLWKLEAINRTGDLITDYTAAIGGFEYTLVGLFDSDMDLGLVAEYSYDDRDDAGVTANQNDLILGTRWVLNDAESTEVLMGFSQDLDYSDTQSLFIEGSTRVGESTVISLDAWFFTSDDPEEISYNVRKDDFIQLDVAFYF
ncbi:hypothetical protein HR060_08115 [Catenovulum sp. SM1970]|uniref:hypothetical protein n=1 Tax=Marinifaba aquimaris TaxID=2741323 RepID=UPI0015742DD6|nr:hypothetical protein [Marinifaba aquimaris]NTS76834.1 hypothetical protein [Marinifaba aquimaris]